MIEYREERLNADTYIDFLKRTDLGSQYPVASFYVLSLITKHITVAK